MQNDVNTYDMCMVAVCDGVMVGTTSRGHILHKIIQILHIYTQLQHMPKPTILQLQPYITTLAYLLAYTPQYKPHVHAT